MPVTPAEVIRAILNDPTNPAVVHRLVASDATYVSLNFDNPELKRIMPWADMRTGPDAVLDTYTRVSRFWRSEAFEIGELFGEGENVALFGRFTYRSIVLGKVVTSPFAILAKVRDGQNHLHAVHGGHVRHRLHLPQRRRGHLPQRSGWRRGGAVSMASQPAPRDVIQRFYMVEATYMNAGGADAGVSFAGVAATLDPSGVLRQSPDLPWGGEFRRHLGYEDWARQMSQASDQLAVQDARFFTDGDTMVITCRLVTHSRASGQTLDLPMAQVGRGRGDRIVEFRPFYWNVPAYRQTVRSAR